MIFYISSFRLLLPQLILGLLLIWKSYLTKDTLLKPLAWYYHFFRIIFVYLPLHFIIWGKTLIDIILEIPLDSSYINMITYLTIILIDSDTLAINSNWNSNWESIMSRYQYVVWECAMCFVCIIFFMNSLVYLCEALDSTKIENRENIKKLENKVAESLAEKAELLNETNILSAEKTELDAQANRQLVESNKLSKKLFELQKAVSKQE